MPVEVLMPKLGLTMTEGLIVEWKKHEGDMVKKGDILFILETEKITYEVEAPEDGVLGAILVPEGETVPVGTVVAYLLREGETREELEALLKEKAAPQKAPEPAPKEVPMESPPEEPVYVEHTRPKASPFARKTARRLEIDLWGISGTGPNGMITSEDVERAAKEPRIQTLEAEGPEGVRLMPLTGMRRAIAKKMMAAKTETAQTYMSVTVDASNLLSYRRKILSKFQEIYGVRVTITDLVMKITAEALKKHPIINTRWTNEGILFFDDIHMGMAMALDEGLVVPVIRQIQKKNIGEIAQERTELIKKGRENRLLPDDITGSTFTVSSMGMYGVEQFTANINVPENAILAVGSIMDKPVALDGHIVIRPMMILTLSYDHRTIDGAEAGKFMGTLKRLLEEPISTLEAPVKSPTARKPKVVVIGGGVAGYPAAITAARMGADVVLVEKDQIGGVCLNRGCIPTKSLLHSQKVLKTVQRSSEFGVHTSDVRADYLGMVERKNRVIATLRAGVERLLMAKKIRVIKGTGLLRKPGEVIVRETGESLKADRIIIATGSRPKRLPIPGAEGPHVWDSNDFLAAESLPPSMVIIGGGVVGIEFSQILQGLGMEVTVLEMMESLVPGTDMEIAQALSKKLGEEGVRIVTGIRVERIVDHKDRRIVIATRDDIQEEYEGDKILISTGREPDLTGIEVEALELGMNKGAIAVNERLETSVPGIYAAGDAIGGIMLAHVAIAEGECAAKNAMGEPAIMDYGAVPMCIYTDPEVACVGLTEEEARKAYKIQVGRFSFHGCGKAHVLDEIYGMVKIISDETSGKVLGVHMIGPHVTDMIAEAVLGLSLGMTAEQLSRAIHPHPTLSEAIMESALTLCGGAIHMP